MKECPQGTLSFEDTTQWMLGHRQAVEAEVYNTTEQVSVIKDWFYSHNVREAALEATNTFVYYKAEFYSFIAQFVDGCSSFNLMVGPEFAKEFLLLFGTPI